MVDYTKYVLKNRDELEGLLAGKDNFFVVACNKCFKEFNTTEEPECDSFAAIAEEQGKHITGTVKVDFLCNKVQTEKKLAGIVPEGTENVVVISCGLGVQTVADLESVPVFTATNSLNYTGHHGMALTKKTCGACAQCYLNVTGGICPIVDCSKSLVNGQCGGAKNGKCEIDPKKDCAWEKIYQRLEKQGRTKEFLDQPIQLRDYSVANVDEIKAYVAEARAKRYEGFYGGVHPTENKEFTEHLALQKFPEPDTVIIPLAMHIGAPANPVVQPGDTVKVGQLIGEQAGFISAPVHSSVSGTVIAVEPHTHPNKGPGVMSVVIKNDGKNTLHESVVPNKPLEELTPDEIIEIVKEKGIVGMGGATFPTYVKLKPGKPIDAVLINGSECEPYLTADHRVMLEFADDIVFGLRAMMKAVSAPEGVILIEDNKADAIAQSVQDTLGSPFYVRHWMEMNANLFAALKLEKIGMFILLTMVVLIGSFSIVTSLVMLVMEKTRDIAILMSMGATRSMIRRIFMLQGTIIGFVGTLLGYGMGLSLGWALKRYRFIKLPENVYTLDHLPIIITWQDVLIIGASAMLLCFLATLYPARQAARLEPAEALRYE